jgi:hypothetical protein
LKLFSIFKTGLVATVIAVLSGCSEPPVPPEVQKAISQEQDLWRAGAVVYAPREYRDYLAALSTGRDLLTRERSRFVWFRDYQPVVDSFREILTRGEQIQSAIRENKAREREQITARLGQLQTKIRGLRNLSESVKDRRLAVRRLMKAEVLIDEAKALYAAGKGEAARMKLDAATIEVNVAAKVIKPLVSRYVDRQQIARWRSLVDDAVAESRRSGDYAIVVSKIDRELVLYKSGAPVKTYPAGMGFNFLSEKLYSGDKATPEGKYRVIKKLPGSKYYRALLIDYPNAEDQRRFAQAKRQNLIAKNAHIGGLIEIHGGGKDGMTNGCVALENDHIQQLYGMVDIGTPVIIVGSIDSNNVVASSMKWLE